MAWIADQRRITSNAVPGVQRGVAIKLALSFPIPLDVDLLFAEKSERTDVTNKPVASRGRSYPVHPAVVRYKNQRKAYQSHLNSAPDSTVAWPRDCVDRIGIDSVDLERAWG